MDIGNSKNYLGIIQELYKNKFTGSKYSKTVLLCCLVLKTKSPLLHTLSHAFAWRNSVMRGPTGDSKKRKPWNNVVFWTVNACWKLNENFIRYFDPTNILFSGWPNRCIGWLLSAIFEMRAAECREHYIPHRKVDVVDDVPHPRGCRTSFTFRQARGFPCDCSWPQHCDSQASDLPPTRAAAAMALNPPPSHACGTAPVLPF